MNDELAGYLKEGVRRFVPLKIRNGLGKVWSMPKLRPNGVEFCAGCIAGAPFCFDF